MDATVYPGGRGDTAAPTGRAAAASGCGARPRNIFSLIQAGRSDRR
jgi:hypothetical protein